jgi:farnesyl diphosphate synthase
MGLSGFADRTGAYRQRIDRALERWLPPAATHPERFHTAIRYSVFGGGQRAGPLLTYAAAEWLALPAERVDAIAVAIELVHAYSVVHDELPVMKDGGAHGARAPTHRAFDEATAILVGDALQAHAYHVLAADARLLAPAEVRRQLIADLTVASGSQGIVGGQAMRVGAIGRMTDDVAQDLGFRKTGRLLQAAVLMPCRLCPELDAGRLDSAARYGRAVGLMWALPPLLGPEESDRRLGALRGEALAAIAGFGAEAEGLRWLCGQPVGLGS